MLSWPELGTRVTVRYRRSPGSVPPLTDAVGYLLAVEPVVRVRTKSGAVAEFAPTDVVALRVLTDTPVRAVQIRGLEHAAASAWPGIEQQWLDGWLLRAGHGATFRANSAVPLDISSNAISLPAIASWYASRNLTPRLAIPDRLLAPPTGLVAERPHGVWVRDVSTCAPDRSVTMTVRPDDAWLRLYDRQVPVDVLTAVIDGELAFGTHAGIAAGRAAVTAAPDGTRWVGVWSVRAAGDVWFDHPAPPGTQEAGAHAGAPSPAGVSVGSTRPASSPSRAPVGRLCAALLAWGAGRGATRAYAHVGDDNKPAIALVESMGFKLHHRSRYFSTESAVTA